MFSVGWGRRRNDLTARTPPRRTNKDPTFILTYNVQRRSESINSLMTWHNTETIPWQMSVVRRAARPVGKSSSPVMLGRRHPGHARDVVKETSNVALIPTSRGYQPESRCLLRERKSWGNRGNRIVQEVITSGVGSVRRSNGSPMSDSMHGFDKACYRYSRAPRTLPKTPSDVVVEPEPWLQIVDIGVPGSHRLGNFLLDNHIAVELFQQ